MKKKLPNAKGGPYLGLTPASEKDAAFWYCKVPESLKQAADTKRQKAKASKVSVLIRLIKYYLRPEVEP